MIRYLTYLSLILVACTNKNVPSDQKELTYKLVDPTDAGEQYLTIIDSNIYYHGKAKEINTGSDSISTIYFISKAVNKGSDNNGTDNLFFYDFQQSKTPLTIDDIDTTNFNNNGLLFSFNIYNSMWGELKGDSIILNSTKNIYYNEIDEITFIKIK